MNECINTFLNSAHHHQSQSWIEGTVFIEGFDPSGGYLDALTISF